MDRKEFEKRKDYQSLEENCWCWEKGKILVKVKMLGVGYLIGDVSKHEIDKDGNVNPSVLITGYVGEEKVSWHGYIRLKDFKGELYK